MQEELVGGHIEHLVREVRPRELGEHLEVFAVGRHHFELGSEVDLVFRELLRLVLSRIRLEPETVVLSGREHVLEETPHLFIYTALLPKWTSVLLVHLHIVLQLLEFVYFSTRIDEQLRLLLAIDERAVWSLDLQQK